MYKYYKGMCEEILWREIDHGDKSCEVKSRRNDRWEMYRAGKCRRISDLKSRTLHNVM